MNFTDLTSQELQLLNKDNTAVVLPLGSIEQHGSHLPLGTKCYLSEAIAYEAARCLKETQINYLILPVLPFMPCHSSVGFGNSFSMGARSFSDALYEIGASFNRNGYKRIYFVNLSLSPDALKAVEVAIADLNSLSDFNAYDPIPLWNYSNNENLDEYLRKLGLDPAHEIHADVKETSAIMYIEPSLIRSEILPELPPCRINSTWEVLKGNFSFKEMGSLHGFLGSPSSANPELGKLYIEEAAFALAESIKFTIEGNSLPELPLQIRMLIKMIDLDEM